MDYGFRGICRGTRTTSSPYTRVNATTLSKLLLDLTSLHRKSCVIFAFALLIGGSRYITNDESAILVTISEDLNIIIPSSATGSATYIDISLDHIESASIDSRANSQSQTPNHVLILKLANDNGATCYVNASGDHSNSIGLAFAEENDAKTLKRLLQPNLTTSKRISQSEGVKASYAKSDDVSGDELAVASPRDSQELRNMATQAASFLSRNPALPSHSTSVQHSMSRDRPSQHSYNVPQSVEGSTSVAMGVNVSKPAPSSNTQPNVRISQGLFKGNTAYHAIQESFDRTSDTGLSSSLRRKKANDLIDNAPEVRDQSDHRSQHQAGETLSPEMQTNDYDSAYDASPKSHNNRPDLSGIDMAPPQPRTEPSETLEKSHRTNPVMLQRISKTSWLDQDAAAANEPQDPQVSEVPITVPGPTNTGDWSMDHARPKKLSERLRNSEGHIENGVELVSNPKLLSSADSGTRDKAKQKTSLKSLALKVTKTKAGIQKQNKQAKKPAVNKGKARFCADRLSDHGDEYDLRSSPEPSPLVTDSPAAKLRRPTRSELPVSRRQKKNAETSVTQSGSKTSHLEFKAAQKANAPKARTRDGGKADKKSIGKVPYPTGSKPPKNLQRRAAKLAIALALPALEGRTPIRAPMKPKPVPNTAPAASTQPRLRRAAAVRANKRIQGLEESDEISDVDDLGLKSSTRRSAPAVKNVGEVSALTTHDERQALEGQSPPHHPAGSQVGVQESRTADSAKGNVGINTSRSKPRKSTSGSKVDTSTPETADLIQGHLAPRGARVHGTKMTEKSPNLARSVVPSTEITVVQKNLFMKEPDRPANTNTFHHDQAREMKRSEQAPTPGDFSKFTEEIPDTEESMTSDLNPEPYPPQTQLGMMGDMEDSHFQEAMPEINAESSYLNQPQKSLEATAEVIDSDKPTKVRHPPGHEHRESALHFSHRPAQDPFGAKLSYLALRAEASTEYLHEAKDLDNSEVVKDETQFQAKASDERQGEPAHTRKAIKKTVGVGKDLASVNVAQDHKILESKASDGIPEGSAIGLKEVDRASNNVKTSKHSKTVHAQASSEPRSKPAKQMTKIKESNGVTKTFQAAASKDGRKEQNITLPHQEPLGLAFGEERSVNDGCREQNEHVKMIAHANKGASAEATKEKYATSAKTPLPVVSLKPGLISWDVSGPRNQGSISARRRKSLRGSHPAVSDVHDFHTAELNEKSLGRKPSSKRKIAPFRDDPAPWEHDRLAQHQKGCTTTPRHNPKHIPQMIPELKTLNTNEKAHRLGSQSTKVDENGSPMPRIHSDQSRHGVKNTATTDDVQFIVDADEFLAREDNDISHEHQLPTFEECTLHETDDHAFASIASNWKQVPSSPHAPSVLASVPAHVVLHSGEIVNETTLESIVPTMPQNPFDGGTQNVTSSFMKLLHKSTAAEKRRKTSESNERRTSGTIKRRTLAKEDDPDRTLVEPEPKRRKRHYYTLAESSSTSETISREISPAEESSDQESDSMTIQWQKTLEPHQANMLDVLSHITNVSSSQGR